MSARAAVPVALPLAAGAVVGVALYAAAPRTYLVWSVHLGLVAGLLGIAGSAVAAAVLVARRRRLRAERALAAAQERRAAEVAEHVHAERLRLLDRLDHELKNPVQALQLSLVNVRASLDRPGAPGAPGGGSAAHAPLAATEQQVRRIGALLGDLRKLTDLERRPLDLDEVDVGQLLHEVRDALAERPGAAERRWSVTVPQAPWPAPRLHADGDLLFLAVHNLADNALKYSRPGDRVELRVSEPEDGVVLVEVADTGAGVPADEVDGVWEELARASTAGDVAGTGLGLSLVRSVARLHGGRAEMRSRVGHGTVVSLRLPVRHDPAAAARPAVRPTPVTERAPL
ncbi:sensor histidine kinase [Actinotalea solisilvae]|uniref:sensor histidine kinase n=1 Tax=Actinotalea solisilvae TaxID=2072922 RepID=UPI0018F1E9B3|nr:HAMP domain-containing sensor histidine kinase [Actinotalea solisilvae]